MARMMKHAELKHWYDKFGSKQDSQDFYEDAAFDKLVEHAAFSMARNVVEVGCGTGRFAERLLGHDLPKDAQYFGLDLSTTMVELARERLQSFGERARVEHVNGTLPLPFDEASADRCVIAYVLDLLPENEQRRLIDEAHRALNPGGLLCTLALTHGADTFTRAVSHAWNELHRLSPSLVGGCRPIEVVKALPETGWKIRHHEVVSAFGVPSEVLVVEAV
jgi:ubiquinone/menaquinone biosynthesis C-methylase UbiE